jgi:hypothetical protein
MSPIAREGINCPSRCSNSRRKTRRFGENARRTAIVCSTMCLSRYNIAVGATIFSDLKTFDAHRIFFFYENT